MRTVSAATHVLHLITALCEERGVDDLTAAQAAVVRAAIDRTYGVALDLPSPEEIEELKARLPRGRS